jgi:hypothetical protein
MDLRVCIWGMRQHCWVRRVTDFLKFRKVTACDIASYLHLVFLSSIILKCVLKIRCLTYQLASCEMHCVDNHCSSLILTHTKGTRMHVMKTSIAHAMNLWVPFLSSVGRTINRERQSKEWTDRYSDFISPQSHCFQSADRPVLEFQI